MKNEKFNIRQATSQDMAAVHALVYELAVFEKMPERVITSVETFIEDSFGENACFETLVAEVPEAGIVGIALFYMGQSTWRGRMLYLEDLIVTEAWRGQGIGLALFNELVALAKSRKVKQMRWQVLDWNQPAIDFYKAQGTGIEDEWLDCKLEF